MYLSQQDLLTSLISLLIIAFALVNIELLVKKNILSKLIGRKLLHVSAITTCAYAIHQFENRFFLALVFLLFFVLLLIVINKGWLQVNHYKTYGIALFPLSFAILLFFTFLSINIIVFAALTLAICDALAGIVGENFGEQKVEFLFEKKSIIGFLTFFTSSFFLSLFYFTSFSLQGILICFTIALITSLTELFSFKGSDNLTVPIFSAITSYIVLQMDAIQLQQLFILNIVVITLCFVVVKKKWLSISGTFAALWIAQFLFISYGFVAFVAPAIFLFSGTFLSKLNKEKKEYSGRNAIQVFANGIVGILCLVLYKLFGTSIFLYCSLASFCVSMVDTCSSEIGKFFNQKTYDIIGLKKISAGISGGVSFAGTLGGLFAAFFITSICYLFFSFNIKTGFAIASFGFIGMLIDSFLGSLVQAKFLTNTGQIVETYEPKAIKTTGFLWCNNDVVNILSNIIATILFYFYLK
jgi:uncharacterized protein (TIGR00297 family)